MVLGFFFLATLSLQAEEKTGPSQTASPGAAVTKRLAVIPFQSVTPADGSSTVRCPICGSINPGGTVVIGAQRVLEEIFTDKLSNLKDVVIIPSEKTGEKIYDQVNAGSEKQPMMEKVLKVGNRHTRMLAVLWLSGSLSLP